MMWYMIFDARAMHDVDDALCLYATDTLKDAKEMQKHYGDCVIGKKVDAGASPIEIMYDTFTTKLGGIMIAKDCIHITICDGCEVGRIYYWCSYYKMAATNCGDDCPKYECKNAKENIKKFWEGK